MTRALLLLAAILFVFSAVPARALDFSPADKQAIDAEVHSYLTSHPEVLIEALNAYQKSQVNAASAQFDKNLVKYKSFLTSASTPFAGNPHGTHVIVEFFDYNCGYCKRAVDDVIGLIKADPQAKIYFKDMPILVDTSNAAAKWALAAGKQGKYYEFHVALMHSSLQRATSTYKSIAEQIGADPAKMEHDVQTDQSLQAAIDANLAASRDLGIQGTPGFVIGDKLYDGYMGLPGMQKAVAAVYSGSAK